MATKPRVQAPEVEVLPPDHNAGALVPFDQELQKRKALREDRQQAASTWMNLVGLKIIGVVALVACLYEAFYPGATQALIAAPYLFSIAAGCLAGPQVSDMILRVLAVAGNVASRVQGDSTQPRGRR